jgi:hypothetical protein
MPNLRTFMVLKILVGEKNAASPAPPGNNSSNYASMPFPSPPLPISKKMQVFFLESRMEKTVTQLMTTKNACDTLQC